MKKKNLLFSSATTALAIIISLGIALVIIAFVSEAPGQAIFSLLLGPLQRPGQLQEFLCLGFWECFSLF